MPGLSIPTLPNWPPPNGEKIGVARAYVYVAWIRDHAGPVLEEAEKLLHARYPGAELGRSAVTVEQLATWSGPSPTMKGLSIGCVWCDVMAGSVAMVDIVLDREGRLVAKPGMNMRDR